GPRGSDVSPARHAPVRVHAASQPRASPPLPRPAGRLEPLAPARRRHDGRVGVRVGAGREHLPDRLPHRTPAPRRLPALRMDGRGVRRGARRAVRDRSRERAARVRAPHAARAAHAGAGHVLPARGARDARSVAGVALGDGALLQLPHLQPRLPHRASPAPRAALVEAARLPRRDRGCDPARADRLSASPPAAPPPAALTTMIAALDRGGARLAVTLPDGTTLATTDGPPAARVVFSDPADVAALARGDHLAVAEAFLAARIDIAGDGFEVMKATDVLDLDVGWATRALWLLKLRLPSRAAWNAASIAFHYDRPADFFLPWFERWRSYSHGFYASPDDDPAAAQARKLQYAIDRLGLRPGMRVFDMGGGWGSFVEYAGRQGIRVETITISREQHRFLSAL